MSDIFISYAREDEERIRFLTQAFEQRGLSVFWDRHIPAGQTWRSYIGKTLKEAKCVVVVWSQNSVASNWVSEEAEEGKRRGVLVPIYLDLVDPPLGFRSIQTADLSNWEPEVRSSSFENLIADINSILNKDDGPTRGEQQLPAARTPPDELSRHSVSAKKSGLPYAFALSLVIVVVGYWYWNTHTRTDDPRTPVLESPPDGTQFIMRTPVNLEWKTPNRSSTPSFEIQVARTASFSPPLKTSHIQHFSHETVSFREGEYGRLFWRVRQDLPDGTKGTWSEARQFTYYPSIIDRILHTKRVRIGIESTRHEGIFASFKDKEFSGIDIELIRFIIARLNDRYRYGIAKDPEIVQEPWGEPLFKLPSTGTADLIISAITKTREREETYGIRFSNEYYTSLQTITVLSDATIESVQDLSGKKLGAEEATTNLQMARSITRSELVKVFSGTDTSTQMFNSLLGGEIDGVCLDTHLALNQLMRLAQRRKFRVFRLTPDKIPATYTGPKTEAYALAVKASEGEFLEQINPIIEEAKSSGFMTRLVSQFMPRPPQLEER